MTAHGGESRSTTCTEPEPLGTAGFLGLVDDLGEDRVLVVNGDTMTDLDMGAVYREHNPEDAATICTNIRSVTIGFGVVHTDADGRMEAYEEKPELQYEVSMGVNVLSAWAMDGLVSQWNTPGYARSSAVGRCRKENRDCARASDGRVLARHGERGRPREGGRGLRARARTILALDRSERSS